VSDDSRWLGQELVSSACAGTDGSLWRGTIGSGLYHIKDGRAVVCSTANGLSDNCVLAVCADAQGTVWAGTRAGDIVDGHSYPGPASLEPEANRAVVVGEFGGLGLTSEGHCWSSYRWAYRLEPDAKALGEAYSLLLRQVWSLHNLHGLSAAVYTQTTDVETEGNGLLSYDRAVAKLDPQVLAQANGFGRGLPPGPRDRPGRNLLEGDVELHHSGAGARLV